KGILPTNILHINPSEKGMVLWYTKAQQRQLYFVESLSIPSGKAHVPPLLWYADKETLSVFALASDRRPTEKAPLYSFIHSIMLLKKNVFWRFFKKGFAEQLQILFLPICQNVIKINVQYFFSFNLVIFPVFFLNIYIVAGKAH